MWFSVLTSISLCNILWSHDANIYIYIYIFIFFLGGSRLLTRQTVDSCSACMLWVLAVSSCTPSQCLDCVAAFRTLPVPVNESLICGNSFI